MSLVTDIAGDWQYIEGVEDVRLITAHPDGAGVRGVKALMKAMGGDPLEDSGAFGVDPNSVTWHLWEETLEGVIPANGDTIRDRRGDNWTIVSVGYSPRSGRYIASARLAV